MAALTLEYSARSDVGHVRRNNEDTVFLSSRMVAVADGVGGAAAGEVASRTAVNALAHLEKCRLTQPLEVALSQTVVDGNEAIAFLSSCRSAYAGMATTLTAVAVDGLRYVIANIGDSRAYLLRGGELYRLTRDDSYVQGLIDDGHITEDQARTHPHRSVVVQALDGRADVRPTVTTRVARSGDRLLVCSDGLSDLVAEDDIRAAIADPATDRDACATRLLDLALIAGGRDNVTVVVADVVTANDPKLTWP